MKNYNYERDLSRKIEKIKRDIEICSLYEAFRSVSEVAKRMNMSRNTVSKVISERFSVENGCSWFKLNLSDELPKSEEENAAEGHQNEATENDPK